MFINKTEYIKQDVELVLITLILVLYPIFFFFYKYQIIINQKKSKINKYHQQLNNIYTYK